MEINTKFRSLKTKLNKLRNSSPEAAKALAKDFAGACAAYAKNPLETPIPKKSGNLRSTARIRVKQNTVSFVTGGQIGNPSTSGFASQYVNYALFVNNGTRNQPAQFFMERTVNAVSTKTGQIYLDAVSSWLRQVV